MGRERSAWTCGTSPSDRQIDTLVIPNEIQVSSSIQNTKHTLNIH